MRKSLVLFAVATLVGCSSSNESAAGPTKTITVEASDYAFTKVDVSLLAKGDTVEFVVPNVGKVHHELILRDGSDRAIATTGEILAGQTGRFTVKLKKSGNYSMVCTLDDHILRGMRGRFTVA